MIEFEDFAVAESVYASGLRQPRHSHDYCNVSIVTAGYIDEETERGRYRGCASSVVLKAAGCEHEDRVGVSGAKTLSIRFARHSRIGGEIKDGAWSWFERPEIVRIALAVQEAFNARRVFDVECGAVALIESVAAAQANPNAAPSWIAQVRETLDKRFDETIRFEDLVRDHGVHPVYASRAFHRHVGVSMTEYVRALRLRHARQQLSSTQRTVAAIAALSGFADSSHLARTFSSLLGVSPRRYRRMTTGEV